MVYLDNTTESQKVFIPRTNIEASAYHPSTGGTEQYYAGQNIEITPQNVINVTGLTEVIESTVSGMTLDYATPTYVDNAVSGKADTTAVTQVSSSVTTVSGRVDTLTYQVQGCMVDVDNLKQYKADKTGVTQSINAALSSYTPTANFATINGSGITSGGNIVIQGGDSTTLEKITTLPSDPVDGAVYNYNGTLIKYVNGPGNWGEWLIDSGSDVNIKSTPGNGTSFTYAGEIPSSMDGLQMCRSRYFTSNIINWFFDLQNNRIVGKVNDVDTYYVVKNGSPVTAQTSFYSQRVTWVNNKISFVSIYTSVGYGAVYPLMDQECSVQTNNAHYELVEPASAAFNYDLASGYSSSVFVTEDGRIRALGIPLTSTSTRINNTFRTYVNVVNSQGLPFMSVPETTGETGTLCVSSGGWVAPIWKTVTQVLGIDFWTGTQAQYDAITTKSATTLYIIIPDNS